MWNDDANFYGIQYMVLYENFCYILNKQNVQKVLFEDSWIVQESLRCREDDKKKKMNLFDPHD